MDYLTPEEIAAKLRVNIATVRRWIKLGELPAYQVGRLYRVEKPAYEAFLKSREVPRPQDSGPKANDLVFSH
jgi:excisionase family DNA binding protein